MRVSLLLAMLFAAASASLQAQIPSRNGGESSADAERLAWTPLRGTAVDLSVGTDGAAFALDREGRVWLRRPGTNAGWIHLPGDFIRLDATQEKLAWAVAADGGLFRYNGTTWRQIESPKARDVGSGPSGDAYVVLTDGSLSRFDARSNTVVAVDGAPTPLLRVDVDERNQPWVVSEEGTPYRFDGRAWVKLPGSAVDISAGGEGVAFIVSRSHEPQRWQPTQSRWQALLAKAEVVAAGADGNPWIATPNGEIFARQPDPRLGTKARTEGTGQTFTQVLSWRRVRGSGQQLVISSRGDVAALGVDGEIWQWKGKDTWNRLPGKLAAIAIEPAGALWGVDGDGRLVRQANGGWADMPGRARLLSIGAEGSVWILRDDGRLARWQSSSRDWLSLDNSPAKINRLAVDPLGQPWIVHDEGVVAQYDGKRWIDYTGIEATGLAIGPEGSVLAVAEGRPWRYNRLNKRWEQMTGEVAALAVGPRGLPWAVTAKHEIYATAFFDEDRNVVATATPSAAGASLTSNGNLIATAAPPAGKATPAPAKEPPSPADFLRVNGVAARDIAIGNDGSVFIVSYDGSLARWSNARNAFVAFPGQLARIAVTGDGRPWGVTVRGEVFRHDGVDWRAVYNITAQDIAVSGTGTVIVSGTDEVLYRYNAVDNSFERILPVNDNVPAPKGSRLALDPQGRPWTITKDFRLWRCDRTPCELQAVAARDIDIGPDGSVFIADSDHKLRRLNPVSGAWDYVNVDADGVAVGPGGKPWFVSPKADVWYSALFRRDESRDLGVAATSVQNTTTAAVPVFTFTVSMPFETVPLPAGFSFSGVAPIHIATGPAGKVVVVDSNFSLWSYNSVRKALLPESPVFTLPWAATMTHNMRTLIIAADGNYWVSDNFWGESAGGSTGVWRRQGSQWIPVQGLADCAATPGCSNPLPASLAAAPDGTVYATSQGGNLYRYDTARQRFVRHAIPQPNANSITDIAVDPNGRLWVTTLPGSNPVNAVTYEYVGNTWVARAIANSFELAGCMNSDRFDGPCVAIPPGGTVYQLWNYKLRRWNAASTQWETISTLANVSSFGIATDGRPWIWDGSSTLYKAR